MEISRRIRWVLRITLVLASLMGLTLPIAAQGAGGVVAGTIKDAQGGALPGVTLTLRNVESGSYERASPKGMGRTVCRACRRGDIS